MHSSVVQAINDHQEQLVSKWKEEMARVQEEYFKNSLPDDLVFTNNEEFIDVLYSSVRLERSEAEGKIKHFAERLIQTDWPLSYFTQGMQAFRRIVTACIVPYINNAEEDSVRLSVEVEEWVDAIVNQLVDDYSDSWIKTLELQQMALNELSAPLIPVFEKVSVMPLIGAIDTERAKLIMENLLDGIIQHRSQVVLIDITGVPVVDTMVANHIIQASKAVRLVGAECILVGIRPEIAQTIVNLGIDLSTFPTKSSLRKGIESALELTQRKMVQVENGAEWRA
ncbi:rsbT co-antagonist protein RsbR [Marinococcus luteus]|uniref:RsbT co-antagonist protein RsbR n=1 Tax=Marinococcus luteus TaxID=1122204 RepID=A0A1H2SYK7_9BACI|nr:STAS domain-containing protein [Marinococcus luteus]SDW36688.1 rsbT co-antagonist protein RsbR [Marinococcus luteus]